MRATLIHTLLVMVTVIALTTASTAMAQETTVWRWVDASGTTHYSQSRPEGVEAERVSMREMRQSRGIDRPMPSDAEIAEREEREAREREEADIQARQQEHREEIEQFCQDASAALERLRGNPRILVTPEDGGDPYRMTEDERQAEIEQLEQQMQEHCED